MLQFRFRAMCLELKHHFELVTNVTCGLFNSVPPCTHLSTQPLFSHPSLILLLMGAATSIILLQQNLCCNKHKTHLVTTKVCLSWQNYVCHDKIMFVVTKYFCCNSFTWQHYKYFCCNSFTWQHYKHNFCMFVVTKLCLLWQNIFVATVLHDNTTNIFVATVLHDNTTNIILSWQKLCHDKHVIVVTNKNDTCGSSCQWHNSGQLKAVHGSSLKSLISPLFPFLTLPWYNCHGCHHVENQISVS